MIGKCVFTLIHNISNTQITCIQFEYDNPIIRTTSETEFEYKSQLIAFSTFK